MGNEGNAEWGEGLYVSGRLTYNGQVCRNWYPASFIGGWFIPIS
jgi:hypothetical protein